jgi:hypothetical protein
MNQENIKTILTNLLDDQLNGIEARNQNELANLQFLNKEMELLHKLLNEISALNLETDKVKNIPSKSQYEEKKDRDSSIGKSLKTQKTVSNFSNFMSNTTTKLNKTLTTNKSMARINTQEDTTHKSNFFLN